MKILVVDIGGTKIKIGTSAENETREAASGRALTPDTMVERVRRLADDWVYDVVSLGYPGEVRGGRPTREPNNLGGGWVGFDYRSAFQRPIKIVNDAAMQALGSYRGGRMLFLGLGTGLGSAMIVDNVVQSMELSQLPYKNGGTFGDFLRHEGLERQGLVAWRAEVTHVATLLRDALVADYVVLGGGNARLIDTLPPSTSLGNNANAFEGGLRLWRYQVSI